MKITGRVARLLIVASVATTAYAFAAGLGGISTNSLAAGGTTVAACDTDGVTSSYTIVAPNQVDTVTITGIHANCAGGQLSVTLANTGGSNIGDGGPTTVSSTSATVTIGEQPLASSITAVHVVIEGP